MSLRTNKNPIALTLIAVGLALMLVGCQSITEFTSFSLEGTPVTSKSWPYSTFVPLRESVQIDVGETLHLESLHVSPAGLAKLEIFVNGSPVVVTASSEEDIIFSNASGNIQILVDAQPGQGNSVEPEFPNSDWTVSLIWIGHVPGTYNLSLVVTDRAGKPGNRVTQWIEVK